MNKSIDKLQESVSTIFEISWNRIENKSPVAAQLIRLCAFLHQQPIPEVILKQGTKGLIGTFELIFNPDALDEELVEASQSGFLRYDSSKKIFILENLVHSFLKKRMSDSEQSLYAGLAVRAVNNVFPEAGLSTYSSQCKCLLPSAQICVELVKTWNLEFEEAAILLEKIGLCQFENNEYAKTESLFKQALAIREQLPDKQELDLAKNLTYLASAYHAQGDYDQAKSMCERALGICENMLGETHSEIAESLSNIARQLVMESK